MRLLLLWFMLQIAAEGVNCMIYLTSYGTISGTFRTWCIQSFSNPQLPPRQCFQPAAGHVLTCN